jgi:hypothetical protein
MALAEADSWLAQGHNLLAFGPPGAGKTHLMAGIGHALIERGNPSSTPIPDFGAGPAMSVHMNQALSACGRLVS